MSTRGLLLSLKLFLMLNLSFSCQKNLAEVNLVPSSFACLSRPQKEAIDICFKQNESCHAALVTAITAPAPVGEWQWISIAVLGGLAGGLVLAQQLRH